MKRGPSRADEMEALYRQGLTFAAIGGKYGVTRSAVQQMLAKRGICGEHGGAHVRAASRLEVIRRKKALRIELKYGVSPEVLAALRECGAAAAFYRQRQTAKVRGVPFLLTLGEWWSVWQASGKFHLRGRGRNGYCMSRIKDKGGYELGNVYIQTVVGNSRDGFANARGKDKPHVGVFCIYPGRAKAWLAKVGKVHVGFFESADEAAVARATYMAAKCSAAYLVSRCEV